MQRNIKVWLVIAILVLAMSCVLAACAGRYRSAQRL